ncbi:MAG: hypothetical protein MUF72_22565 [Elainella sp. Prado103]|nr:hypothetical protein [Elainella sp. Prado103]
MTQPEPGLPRSQSPGHHHPITITRSQSPDRNHPVTITQSPSPDRNHPVTITQSPSPDRNHWSSPEMFQSCYDLRDNKDPINQDPIKLALILE